LDRQKKRLKQEEMKYARLIDAQLRQEVRLSKPKRTKKPAPKTLKFEPPKQVIVEDEVQKAPHPESRARRQIRLPQRFKDSIIDIT